MTSTPNTIPDEVSILILGGLSHTARSHLTWLISKEGEEERLVEGGGDKVPKVKFVRIVDKYLVNPGASTTYIDPPCLRALEDPRVEYIQMNLSIPENLKKAFTPPEDKGGLKFDIVYDLIGEGVIHSEIPEEVLLEKQVKVCHMAGLEAKRRGVSVYLRETVHFMTVGVDQPAAKEGDEVKPRTARAYWYYETERALACVEGLNLVIVRPASVFGPHIFHGLSIPRFGMGSLYRVTGETMKWLWGPNLKVHTIHPRDLARANWKISLWAMERGRERTESEAGEVLEPVRIKDSSKSKEGFREKVGLEQGCCPRDRSPKVAVFNVVDDEDMDQGKLLKISGEYWEIQTGFVNAAINAYARINLAGCVDEMNEKHGEILAKIFERYSIGYSPISTFMDVEALSNKSIALDNSKIKRRVGWRPMERLDLETCDQVIKGFIEAGVFVDLKKDYPPSNRR